jgi:hypothetical protein
MFIPMASSIATKIRMMADPETDKVVLLLSELVDEGFDYLSDKLDGIVEKIDDIGTCVRNHQTCPVIGNEEHVKLAIILFRYPKIMAAAIVGLLTSLGISLGLNLDVVRNWLLK